MISALEFHIQEKRKLDDEYSEFVQEIDNYRMKRLSTEFPKLGGVRDL